MIRFRFVGVVFLFFTMFSFCGSFFEIETGNITVELCYENVTVKWSEATQNSKIELFEYSAEAQRHNRGKGREQKLLLADKLLKMGFSCEETVKYCFRGLTQKVDDFCDRVNKQPIDATISFNPNLNSNFLLTHESFGRDVDKNELYKNMLQGLKTKKDIKICVNPTVLKPKVYYEDLIKLTSLKSSFSTNYAQSGENRKHNIKKALGCFNGLVLKPGDECSFNKATKQRTEANGYKQANVIVNEEYIEAFGGGVCQVSTTLYNALLLAGVHILESHPHSLKSGYVLEGFDAMVNYGSSDLRFKNTFDYPLFIKTWATDCNIYVNIYGRVTDNIKVRRVNKIVREIEPKHDKVLVDETGEYADKVYYTDQSFVKTRSKKGMEVYSYLEYWQNDKLIDKKLIRKQTYKPVSGVIIKGAHKREEIESDFLSLG